MDDTSDSPAAADYFRAVEEGFARLRGTPLLLSPRDVALVDAWWQAGIPVRVVLQAVESVFARRREAGEAGRVMSLAYCRHAVEGAFHDWQEGRLGAGPGAAEPAVPAPVRATGRIRELAEQLGSRAATRSGAARAALQEAAGEVGAVAHQLEQEGGPPVGEAEERLEALEDRLLERLLAAMDPAARAALEAEVEASLADLRSRLTERAYCTTRQGQLRAAIRARESLPRLTLYLV